MRGERGRRRRRLPRRTTPSHSFSFSPEDFFRGKKSPGGQPMRYVGGAARCKSYLLDGPEDLHSPGESCSAPFCRNILLLFTAPALHFSQCARREIECVPRGGGGEQGRAWEALAPR